MVRTMLLTQSFDPEPMVNGVQVTGLPLYPNHDASS
jgi:hypothetical protein